MNGWDAGLKKLRRRVRVARAWRGIAVGGGIGAILCAAWAGLDWLRVFYTEWSWMGVLAIACALVGLAVGAAIPVRDQALGDSIDRRAGLKNRVGTAMAGVDAPGEFVEAQRDDALRSVAALKPAQVFPLRFCRWHWILGLFGGIAAALFLMGNTPILMSADKRQERAELQDAAASVERVAKPVADDSSHASPEEKAVAHDLQQFARELRKGRLDKEEALQKADELAKKADELSRKKYSDADRLVDEAQTAYEKGMKEKLDDEGLSEADPNDMKASDAENEAKRQALSRQIGDLKKQLENSAGKSAAEKGALQKQLEQAQKDLQTLQLSEKAKQTLAKLFAMKEFQDLQKLAAKLKQATSAGKQGQDKLTPEMIKQMQQQLEDLAKQLKDEKAMRDYIQKLREAMKKAQGG